MTNSKIPFPAGVLGAAGLIPFAGIAVSTIYVDRLVLSELLFALVAYGAVILSFLGGVHWGAAISRQPNYLRLLVSVIPSLLGWAAVLLPYDIALMLLISGFILMWLVDYISVRKTLLPAWYARLRTALSIVVVAALGFTLIRYG